MVPVISLFLAAICMVGINGLCETIYTMGDDELCEVYLTDGYESCITFDANYSIAAGNGLAMDPISGELYLIVSIGASNGNRELVLYDDDENMDELTSIASYSSGSQKLAGITFTCSGDLYGVTGSQSAHDLFSVNVDDGSLTMINELDGSNKGTGITYNPMDGYLYRVAGTTRLDIERIDLSTGNITKNYYINSTSFGIQIVRAIGYYHDNFLFLIDSMERLFELDVSSGDVTHLYNLTSSRKHKGIVCTDYADICYPPTTSTTQETYDMTDMTDSGDDVNMIACNIMMNVCIFVIAFMMF